MALQIEHSHVIDRSVDKVFHFMVVDHVKNHPRWDSDIELWLDSNEPIGVGTIINRRNSRSGTPVEGTMEVTEYETNQKISTVIREGSSMMIGEIYFEAVGDDQTKVTTKVNLPNMDKNADTSFLMQRLEEVGKIRKNLIESEV